MVKTLRCAFLALAFTVFGGSAVHAACNCSSSTAAPYCTGEGASVTSAAGTTATITLDSTYQCGQYANGDFWIVGKGAPKVVKVVNTTPAWDGRANGWDANRAFNQQHMESRGITSNFAGAPNLPAGGYDVSTGPVSFMKAVGRPTGSVDTRYVCSDGYMRETCVKFSPVFTLVPAVPDSDGDGRTDDEFRPGPTGSSKLGPHRVDMIEARVAALPRLSAAAAPNREDYSFARILSKYGQGCARTYTSDNIIQMITASDCMFETVYGTDIAMHNRSVPLRFLLSDFNWNDPVHRGALIAYVQHGIDIAQHVSDGWRTRSAPPPIGNGYLTGMGGIMVGHKDPVVFAAYMLQQPGITSLGQGNYYFESDQVYRSSVDNRVYYGVGILGTHPFCPDDGSGGETGVHCYHPSKQMDAGCGGSPKSYQSQVSNSGPYTELWVRALGAQSFWKDDPWLEFNRAWNEGGRAPGHTHYLWSSAGGSNGCSNQRWNTGYMTRFGEEMWAAFKGLGGGTPVPSPPPSLQAPQQLLD